MINTEIVPTTTQGLYIRIKFKFNSFIPSAVNGIWGYMYSTGSVTPRFSLFYDDTSKIGSGVNTTVYFQNFYPLLNTIYDIVLENGIITAEDKTLNVGIQNTNNNSMPIYFGARADYQGNPTWPSDIDIYEFEIIYGGVHKYFIPILDINGTPCMYDKVEDKFYYNAGTGQFIAGPAI